MTAPVRPYRNLASASLATAAPTGLADRSDVVAPWPGSIAYAAPPDLCIFQTSWWLDAVSDRSWTSVSPHPSPGARPTDTPASLPVYLSRRLGCTVIGMPPLTSMLGPVIASRNRQRRELLRALIAGVPAHTKFRQVFQPDPADAFCFATHGFDVGVQYTFTLAPAASEDAAWRGLDGTTRNVVRKGLALFDLDTQVPADLFYRFLDRNVRRTQTHNRLAPDVFLRAEAAARARDSVAILCARTHDGLLAAGIMVIWDQRRMYYLLTTRDPDRATNAAVPRLLWEAVRLARGMGLLLDFDSYGSAGGAAFTGGFGGQLEPRFVVSRLSRTGIALDSAQRMWRAATRSA